jgi:hypothetical protein
VVQESGTGRSGGRSNRDERKIGVVEEEMVNKYLQRNRGA